MDVVLVMLGVFVIAFAFAPLGLGGGMLFVPLLHYALKQPIDGTTLAISLALTWAVSIGSGARHRREGSSVLSRRSVTYVTVLPPLGGWVGGGHGSIVSALLYTT